jgi:SUF system FeS cluster assembly, SufBD
MTKILAPLSVDILRDDSSAISVAHLATKKLSTGVHETFFVDSDAEKKITQRYEVSGKVFHDLFFDVQPGVSSDIFLSYLVYEKYTKLQVRVGILLHPGATVSLDIASLLDVREAENDVRIFVVFNEGSKATVRAFTRAMQGETMVHEEIRGLMLGDAASASFIPELSLLHDDIVATHATSMVKLDEKQLAYFLSRGVLREHATQCLVDAFLGGM